jgi:hypothetical protein
MGGLGLLLMRMTFESWEKAFWGFRKKVVLVDRYGLCDFRVLVCLVDRRSAFFERPFYDASGTTSRDTRLS